MRELEYVSEARNEEKKLLAEVSHSMYDVQFSFGGKKVFKDTWLRKRFPLLYKDEKVIDADTANALLARNGIVKQK